MSTKRSGGSSKNLTDSNPQYLGTKLHDGEVAASGNVIVRQRGTKIMAGKNVRVGVDHTLYAATSGKVRFTTARKQRFDGRVVSRKVAHVVPS